MCVSVASWAIIALKHTQLSRARAQSLAFLDTFWKGTRLDAIYQTAQGLKAPRSPRCSARAMRS
jgi:biopolymer transport protein TolQ